MNWSRGDWLVASGLCGDGEGEREGGRRVADLGGYVEGAVWDV